MRAPKAHNKITGIFNKTANDVTIFKFQGTVASSPALPQCGDTVAIDSHKHRPDESSDCHALSIQSSHSALRDTA